VHPSTILHCPSYIIN